MQRYCVALAAAYILGVLLPGSVVPSRAEDLDEAATSLGQFVRRTVNLHPALDAAKAALESARARARGQGRPLYNPELGLEYEDAESKSKQVGLSQTFDWSGKRGARRDVARAEVEAAAATVDLVRTSLLTELLTALAAYRAQLQSAELNERRVGLLHDFLALAEQRYAAGDLEQTELLTARLTLMEARIAARNAGANLLEAEETLVGLVGRSEAVWPALTGLPDRAPDTDLSLLDGLPELRLARSETEAFRSRIQVARKNRVPDPTVGVNYGEEGSDRLLAFGLSLPLPVRNTFRAEVEAASADFISAERSYSEIFRRAKARLQKSNARYRLLAVGWKDWQEAGRVALQEQTLLLNNLWRIGEISTLDYLFQLNQTLDAATASIDLRGRQWGAWLEWLEASGTIGQWVENLQ